MMSLAKGGGHFLFVAAVKVNPVRAKATANKKEGSSAAGSNEWTKEISFIPDVVVLCKIYHI
jgi:hypothetical protein